jgi:hypothetical protein
MTANIRPLHNQRDSVLQAIEQMRLQYLSGECQLLLLVKARKRGTLTDYYVDLLETDWTALQAEDALCEALATLAGRRPLDHYTIVDEWLELISK